MALVGAMRLILLALLLPACGVHPGERPGSELGTIDLCSGAEDDRAECGGELTREWNIEGVCLASYWQLLNPAPGLCNETAVLSLDLLEAGGQYRFEGNGRGTESIDLRLRVNSLFSAACLSSRASAGETAYSVCSRFDDGTELGGVGDCELVEARCSCTADQRSRTDRTFDWSGSGSSVTLVYDGEGEEQFTYCVDGGRLTLEASDGSRIVASD